MRTRCSDTFPPDLLHAHLLSGATVKFFSVMWTGSANACLPKDPTDPGHPAEHGVPAIKVGVE